MKFRPVASRGALPLFVLLALMALGTAWPEATSAQETFRVLDTQVTADFPTSVTFHLEVQGQEPIARAEVRFRVEQQSCAQTEGSGFAEFSPGTHVTTSWKWDTRKGGTLPPGAVVRYRWLIRTASGGVEETPERAYQVDDSRFSWQTMREGRLELFWHLGDQTFAKVLMEAAQAALARLEVSTGSRPERSVKLFVYGSTQDLHGALVFPEEWTGGVFFGGFNIIAIGIAPDELSWGQRAIAHELAHMIVDQLTFNCLRDIPTWLSEGLATYNEDASGKPPVAYAEALVQGITGGRLISVRGLSGGFPTAQGEALLAYGQSFSLVQYLVKQYGPSKLGRLLSLHRAGHGTDEALKQVYEFDQEGLDREWRQNIGAPPVERPPSVQSLRSLVPPGPTIEPYALPNVSPGGSATPEATSALRAGKPASSGGCNRGMPTSPRTGGGRFQGAAYPLVVLALAGLALRIRRGRG